MHFNRFIPMSVHCISCQMVSLHLKRASGPFLCQKREVLKVTFSHTSLATASSRDTIIVVSSFLEMKKCTCSPSSDLSVSQMNINAFVSCHFTSSVVFTAVVFVSLCLEPDHIPLYFHSHILHLINSLSGG